MSNLIRLFKETKIEYTFCLMHARQAKTRDCKFSLYVSTGSGQVSGGMFRKQKCSLGSYLIVGKENQEKINSQIFSSFFEDFNEKSLMTSSSMSERDLRSLFITLLPAQKTLRL